MTPSLPVHIDDPLERVRLTAVATSIAKENHQLLGPMLLPAWMSYLPPSMAPGIFRAQARRVESASVFNLTISNVPGPRERGVIEGAMVSEIYSVGPVVAGSGMNITVWSYVDQLAISVMTDDRTLDDPHEATDAMLEAFDEIRAAAGISGELTPVGVRAAVGRGYRRGLADPAAAAQPPVARDDAEDQQRRRRSGRRPRRARRGCRAASPTGRGRTGCRRSGSACGSPWTSPMPRTAHLRRRRRCVVSTSVLATVAPHGWAWRCRHSDTGPHPSTTHGRSVVRHGGTVRRQGRLHHRCGAGSGPVPRGSVRRGGRRHHRRRPVRTDRQRRVPDADAARTSTRPSTWSRRRVGASWPSRRRPRFRAAQGGRGQRRRRIRPRRLRARQRRDLACRGTQRLDVSAFVDAVDVMLNGVYFTIEAALPAMLAHGEGGAIVITSSAAGFKSVSIDFDTISHGAAGYTAAKHGVIGVMRHFATSLAEKNIRVNSVHPGGVATPMIINEAMAATGRRTSRVRRIAAADTGDAADGTGRGDQRDDGVPVRRVAVGTSPVSRCRGRRADAQVSAL